MNSLTRMGLTTVLVALFLACGFNAQAADITKPYTLQSGQVIKASELNANFDTAYGKINELVVLLEAIKNPGSQHLDNGDGTVTDRLTGLVWLKNANCFGTKNWDQALAAAVALASGQCGLTDNSVAGAWRVPTIMELQRLQQMTWPVQATSHPFTGVQSGIYWSSTTVADNTSLAWNVSLGSGIASDSGMAGGSGKTYPKYVWPVRGGQ